MLAKLRSWLARRDYREAVQVLAERLLRGFVSRGWPRRFSSDRGVRAAIEMHEREGIGIWQSAAFTVALFVGNELSQLPYAPRAAADDALLDWKHRVGMDPNAPYPRNPLAAAILEVVREATTWCGAGHISNTEKEILFSEMFGALKGISSEQRADGRLEGHIREAVGNPIPTNVEHHILASSSDRHVLAEAHKAGGMWVESIDATFLNMQETCRAKAEVPRAVTAVFLGWLSALRGQMAGIYREAGWSGDKLQADWALIAYTYSQRFLTEVLAPLFGERATSLLSTEHIEVIVSNPDHAIQQHLDETEAIKERSLDIAVSAVREQVATGAIALPPCSDSELREAIRRKWDDEIAVDNLLDELKSPD